MSGLLPWSLMVAQVMLGLAMACAAPGPRIGLSASTVCMSLGC